jgi:RNA polymerase sigma-70 factor (ECF subfamily)
MGIDEGRSDAALVVAIGRFDESALRELYDRHGGAVFALARRLLNSRTLAEEVAQEIFLRLWNRPERFDPDRGTLRSFLLADTHGRSIDLLRSEAARRERETKEGRMAPTPSFNLESEVLANVQAETVRNALAELSDGERNAIELAYFGGYTYREVAEQLGEPEGTVKSRIRTGMKRLRGHLASAGVAPS